MEENYRIVSFTQNHTDNSPQQRDDNQNERLNHWLNITAADEKQQKLFRRPKHEREAELMLRPILPKAAFGHLGLMLGILPPAAIFSHFLFDGFRWNRGSGAFLFVFLLMNVICAVVGRGAGRSLSGMAFNLERSSWTTMLLVMPFVGALWGIMTGFLGGLIFFGFGGIAGAFIAAPIGAIAFTLFAILHRWLERGTQIDRRQLIPIAYGISLTIAAFCFGL